jgi:signal transduction histidine kinase
VLPGSLGLAALVLLLFLAVAAGAWPVVRRLTRRLEDLQRGVETFGSGTLSHRVDASGRDEVAAVAASFNRAAERVETLVRSHQTLLANASHELRSPLARLKMAVALLEDAPSAQRQRLRAEIDENVRELDALVEEVLLASRLDAAQDAGTREPVDILALAVEEAARAEAEVTGLPPPDGRPVGDPPPLPPIAGDERLLRRALRNLLENARRYGGGREIVVQVGPLAGGGVQLRVCDRGPGVPAAWRERIFEPFLRLPGHAEREGGVGLGLSLVRQIAQRHGGQARCEARPGGGSCFVLDIPGTASQG